MPGPVDPYDFDEDNSGPLNDEHLEAEGAATGLDVWEPVMKSYLNYVDGDSNLANCQLWSLREAVRKEYAEELGVDDS